MREEADMSLTTGVEHSPTSATGTSWEALSRVND
jgi:hypothetical protein